MKTVRNFLEYYAAKYDSLLFENVESISGILAQKYRFAPEEIEIFKRTLPDDNKLANASARFVASLMKNFVQEGGRDVNAIKQKYIEFLKEDGEDIKKTLTDYFMLQRKGNLFNMIKNDLTIDDKIFNDQLSGVSFMDNEQLIDVQNIPNLKDINTIKDFTKLTNLVSIANALEKANKGFVDRPVIRQLKEVKGELEFVLEKEVNGNDYQVWCFKHPKSASKLLRPESSAVLPGAKDNKWCLKDPSHFVNYGKSPKKYNRNGDYVGEYENYIIMKNGLAYICFDFESFDCKHTNDNEVNNKSAMELAPVIGDLIKQKLYEYYDINLDDIESM